MLPVILFFFLFAHKASETCTRCEWDKTLRESTIGYDDRDNKESIVINIHPFIHHIHFDYHEIDRRRMPSKKIALFLIEKIYMQRKLANIAWRFIRIICLGSLFNSFVFFFKFLFHFSSGLSSLHESVDGWKIPKGVFDWKKKNLTKCFFFFSNCQPFNAVYNGKQHMTASHILKIKIFRSKEKKKHKITHRMCVCDAHNRSVFEKKKFVRNAVHSTRCSQNRLCGRSISERENKNGYVRRNIGVNSNLISGRNHFSMSLY